MTVQQLMDILDKIDDKNKQVQLQIRMMDHESLELVVADLKVPQEYSSKIALYGESQPY
jgi:hypothetical protein